MVTDLAWAAFSSGEALGSNRNAGIPAFFDSSVMTASASSAVTLLLGSCAAIAAPWDLSSPARESRSDIILAGKEVIEFYERTSKSDLSSWRSKK